MLLMSSDNRKSKFWSAICIIGIIISLIITFALYANLPPLRSGYSYKTDYLLSYLAYGWVPLIFFSLILFLIKKNNHPVNNNISSDISDTKPYEKPIHKKKSELKNYEEKKNQKKIRVNSEEEIRETNSKSEEEIYDLIGKEIEEKNLKRGIWTKAIAESNGDKEKAEATYIKLRFEQMKSK